MRPVLMAVLAFLASAASLAADPLVLGEPFPLTSTRYGEAAGHPHLVSNGNEVFLFWASETHIRFTRLGGDAPPSRAVMRRSNDSYAVVWTGKHFLLVAGTSGEIAGQLLDVNGDAIGERFTIARGAWPRIAFDGTSVLLLFRRTDTNEIHAQLLTRDGRPASDAKPLGLHGTVQTVASNGLSFAAVVADLFHRDFVMFERDGDMASSAMLADPYYGYWSTLASDGDRYLMVDSFRSPIEAHIVTPDGTVGAPLALDVAHGWDFTAATAVWTGSKWVAAFAVSPIQLPDNVEKKFTIVQLDRDARTIEKREEREGVWVSLAARGEALTVAWLPRIEYGDIIRVADLPLGTQGGMAASWAATRQTMRGSVAAPHGTLVLWEEGGALHSGLRSHDGRWREQLVWAQYAYGAEVATGGDTFAVVVTTPDGWYVMQLDRDGKKIGEPVNAENFYPSQIFWNGSEYIVYGSWGNDLVVASFRDGVLGPLRTIDLPHGDMQVLVAGDDGYLAIWILTGPFQTPGGAPNLGVAGIRLDRDFVPRDAAPMTFVYDATDDVYSASAGWDGAQYVVAWSSAKGIKAAHVPATGGTPILRNVSNDPLGASSRVTKIDGGVAIDWQQYPEDGNGLPTPRVALLFSDGSASETRTLRASRDTTFAALPGGNVAVFETLLEDDDAVEGTHRITMSVLSRTSLPRRPSAPRVIAALRDGTAEVRWSPPVESVTGYRVEYRLADGPWIELDRVLAPEERSASIAIDGKKAAVRVRAWNEGGTGEYSAAAIVNGKRRPVR